jgi:hypothetical protein
MRASRKGAVDAYDNELSFRPDFPWQSQGTLSIAVAPTGQLQMQLVRNGEEGYLSVPDGGLDTVL